MYTVVETNEFRAQAAKLWSDAEREDFVCWIAANPEAGDVIPGADGARVIYFNQLADGLVILIAVYAKSAQSNLPTKKIRGTKREAEKH